MMPQPKHEQDPEPRNENWTTHYGHEISEKLISPVLSELQVSQARLDEKFNNLLDKLDTLTDKFGKILDMVYSHEQKLTALMTEKDTLSTLFGWIAKPLFIVLIISVSFIVGHAVDLSKVLDWFK